MHLPNVPPDRIVEVGRDAITTCNRCGQQAVWLMSPRTKRYYLVAPTPEALAQKERLLVDKAAFHTCYRVAAPPPVTPAATATVTPTAPVTVTAPSAPDRRLALAVPQITAALMVLITTPDIRQWLQDHDPQALRQAETALAAGGLIPPPDAGVPVTPAERQPAQPSGSWAVPPDHEYEPPYSRRRRYAGEETVEELERMYAVPEPTSAPTTNILDGVLDATETRRRNGGTQ